MEFGASNPRVGRASTSSALVATWKCFDYAFVKNLGIKLSRQHRQPLVKRCSWRTKSKLFPDLILTGVDKVQQAPA